jgi:EmrB/QacA subfamily drug resistance transporter
MLLRQPGLPGGLVGEADNGKIALWHAVSQSQGSDNRATLTLTRAASRAQVVSCQPANDMRDTLRMGQAELASQARGRRHRWLVLAICCLSLFIAGIDVTIVNVALPSIGRDLHASVSGLQWTVDAYTIVVASFLMLSGSTGDRVGRRRTFQTGLAVFTLGSLLCSLAPGLGWLVAFRMLQAIGGSMLNPVALSIITNTFTDRGERARAIGVWGSVFGVSMALGPIAGGALVSSVGWRGIFWVNIPVGLAAIALTALYVPESRAPRARRVDPVGQVLVITALAALTYAIIEGPSAGWTSAPILGCFGVAAAALIGLVGYEPRRAEPLLDLRFFRSVPFSGATVTAVCAFAALGGFLFLNTLYLQEVRGYSALHAGLYTLPMAAMTVALSPVSGRIVAARGPRLPTAVAGVATLASGIMLTRLARDTSFGYLILSYVIFGIGSGLVNPPITNAAVSGMPVSQAGVAAGVASTSRQVGAALGVAVVGSAALSALHGPFRPGFADASHAGWWIIAGCGAAILLLGLVTSGRWARGTAERTAGLLVTPAARVPVSAP